MKTIILFRHSESEYKSINSIDHDRHLTNDGIEIAKKMGLYLSNIKNIPDLVISSTALRAKATAEAANNEAWNSKLKLNPKIYKGDINTLIKLVANENDIVNTICLVGHEPYLSSFVCKVTNRSYINFPIASMAKINFETGSWIDIDFYNAELEWITRPGDFE